MKTINLEEIKEFLSSPEMLEKKVELLGVSDIFEFKISDSLSQKTIQAKVNNFDASFIISNEIISEYNCSCEIYLSAKKICEHIFCLIETYNQYVRYIVNKYEDVKDVSFEIAPIILEQENGTKKIVIEFYFNCNYKKFFVSNVKDLF
ncbi:MAG: hypothetical protein K2F52_02000, partial [Malacoplasma sp.]|nr:hypothetical protein [Malacoplasma sp.]